MGSVIVIGAGLAGAHTVETLRDEGFEGQITLVGAEDRPPYERPPLSKEYLQGRREADALLVQERSWYDGHGVTLRTGDPVEAIDRAAGTVRLSSGADLGYDHVVLATGARPRRLDLPGADSHGVMTLRTLEDSTVLRAGLLSGGRVVILGGGWIGLEVAAAARRENCEVTVIEREPFPLRAVLGDTVGAHVAALHRRHGVDLLTRTTVTGIDTRDGRATGVATSAGTVPADLVLVAVGAVPDTGLAEAAGLDVDRGVLVDRHLRSSDPALLAAGDVAHADHVSLGRLRVEHWDNAIRQGRLAALSILGRPEVYDWQPYFFTDQYEVSMEYVGHAAGQDEVVVRGSLDEAEHIVFWLREGRLRAAMNVNIWDVNDQLRALLGRRLPPGSLADAGISLQDLASAPC